MGARKTGALFVIAVITLVVVFVVAMNIDTWRNRTNPSMTNGGPANAAMPVRPPAPAG